MQSTAAVSRLRKAYDQDEPSHEHGGREAPAFEDCPMRVGLVCPVWFPVPPEAYGGTERVVALLADGHPDATRFLETLA